MDSKSRERVVRGWIELQQRHHVTGKIPKDKFWASKQLSEIVSETPELAWELILQILATDQSDVVVENLAAGPLEDFLVYHGQEYIDRVEDLARVDPAFNMLLGGVWENDISPEVWNRVQKVRKQIW